LKGLSGLANGARVVTDIANHADVLLNGRGRRRGYGGRR